MHYRLLLRRKTFKGLSACMVKVGNDHNTQQETPQWKLAGGCQGPTPVQGHLQRHSTRVPLAVWRSLGSNFWANTPLRGWGQAMVTSALDFRNCFLSQPLLRVDWLRGQMVETEVSLYPGLGSLPCLCGRSFLVDILEVDECISKGWSFLRTCIPRWSSCILSDRW